MRIRSAFAFSLATALVTACNHLPRTEPPAENTAGAERRSFTGIAQQRKMGAALRGENFYLWIDGLHFWPEHVRDRRVTATGILEERHDLPVFVADTPEERGRLQGIPVPSGTDLHEASRRQVLRDATWRLAD